MKTHPVLVKHYNAVIEGFISDLENKEVYPQDFDPELVKQFLELTDPNRDQTKRSCKCHQE